MASLTLLMMAAPSRITSAAILAAASALLEEQGPGGLSMRALARRLGVQAPSLYFHVESRDDLVHLLVIDALTALAARMEEAEDAGGDLFARAMRLAAAYVAFGREGPQRFALLFGPCPADEMLDLSYSERATAPVLRFAADAVGPGRAVPFAQALWALVHGYAVLELAGQFRLAEDSGPALELGIRALLAGGLRLT